MLADSGPPCLPLHLQQGPGGPVIESACGARDAGQSLAREGPLEAGMATHASILAWRTPRTEESEGYSPGGHTESA